MKDNYSLYIHIPYCISKCSYCDFFSVPIKNCNFSHEKKIPDEYVEALCLEIKERIQENLCCKSIYIGGGTPSLLSNNHLLKIVEVLKSKIDFNNDIEFTIECNPDDVSVKLLNTFDKCGVNRISCGIQSLNDSILQSLNRRAGVNENINALELMKKIWKHQISIDLISSLPGESDESFLQGLKKVVDYKPEHISLYSLTIEDETPLGQDYLNGKFEYDFDSADDMWIKGRDFLTKNGYIQYEISNFCLNKNYCRHNMAYWQHKDYIGVGCGATGTIYANGKGVRRTNINNIENYISYWLKRNQKIDNIIEIEEVDEKTSIFEYFMMGLRTSLGVNSKQFEEIFNKSFPESVIKLFRDWELRNKAKITKIGNITYYTLTTEGMLFLNQFLQDLEI